jgi:hypothetical protein
VITENFIADYFKRLRSMEVSVQNGLSDDELASIEGRFGFKFPSDLRSVLKLGLPVSEKFPDWRSAPAEKIQERLNWPADGICFDVEHNKFWMEEWGAKPSQLAAAFAVARSYARQASLLIPIYSHRYIPTEPNEAGNPVFSVYQTDIIYYGTDLASYLTAEFKFENPFPIPAEPKPIRFWAKLEIMNGKICNDTRSNL